MGIYINLEILPGQINPDEWKIAYLESLELIKSFPFMGLRQEEKNGVKRFVYSRNVEKNQGNEKTRHWIICGDLDTKEKGESFELYYDISHYDRRKSEKVESNEEKDIIFVFMDDNNASRYVFDNKTQGCNYHIYILAIAMLIESRFPYTACVSGDIDVHQAKKAQKWANGILDKPIELPVRVDAEKLHQRLSVQYGGEELVETFKKLYLSNGKDMWPEIIKQFDRNTVTSLYTKALMNCEKTTQGATNVFIKWLNETQDLHSLIKMACVDENGPKYDVLKFAEELCKTWLMLPPELFKNIKAFDNTYHNPDTFMAQIDMGIVDILYSGRKITYYMEQEEVIRILQSYFPNQIEEITNLIADRVNSIKQTLSMYGRLIEPTTDVRECEPHECNFDELIHYHEKSVLSEKQKLLAVGVMCQFNKYVEQYESGDSSLFRGSHLTICRQLYQKGIALTEEAWNWIDEEQDEELLYILIAFLLGDIKYEELSKMRRAVLENREFCKKVKELMNNKKLVKKFEKE